MRLPLALWSALSALLVGCAVPSLAAEPAVPPAGPSKPKARLVDPMDKLRDRLATKLGVKPSTDVNPNELHVAVRGSGSTSALATSERDAPVGKRFGARHHAAPAAPRSRSSEWSYVGPTGPDHWGSLRPEFSLCAKGNRQSPIDIRDGISVQLDPVQFEYKSSAFGVIDTGRTVQVNVAPGNFIEAMGRRYELVRFDFQRPAEERIEGRQFDMGVHLIHRDAQGRMAVVALLLDRGADQPIIQTIWNNLPLEKGEEFMPKASIDVTSLLPSDQRYYTYMGSMTTPPCKEGVLWMVMKSPVSISSEQLATFSRLYAMNARPVQASSGRLIKGP